MGRGRGSSADSRGCAHPQLLGGPSSTPLSGRGGGSPDSGRFCASWHGTGVVSPTYRVGWGVEARGLSGGGGGKAAQALNHPSLHRPVISRCHAPAVASRRWPSPAQQLVRPLWDRDTTSGSTSGEDGVDTPFQMAFRWAPADAASGGGGGGCHFRHLGRGQVWGVGRHCTVHTVLFPPPTRPLWAVAQRDQRVGPRRGSARRQPSAALCAGPPFKGSDSRPRLLPRLTRGLRESCAGGRSGRGRGCGRGSLLAHRLSQFGLSKPRGDGSCDDNTACGGASRLQTPPAARG